MYEEVVTAWLKILQPDIEEHLGPFPAIIVKQAGFQEIILSRGRLTPWHVRIENKNIIFAYHAMAIEHFFVSPSAGDEPHPNALGRFIFDLLNDLAHPYQAAALYRNGTQRFFNRPSHDLSIEGLAQLAAFEICVSLWEKAEHDFPRSELDLYPSFGRFTHILRHRAYRESMQEMLFWEIHYSYRAAAEKGWFQGPLESFPLLAFLPASLKSQAQEQLTQFSQSEEARSTANPDFAIYDLGLYLCAHWQLSSGLTLRDLLNAPPPPKSALLKKVDIAP